MNACTVMFNLTQSRNKVRYLCFYSAKNRAMLHYYARRLSVERNSYSDVAGWVAGWLGGWLAVCHSGYCIKTTKRI